MCVANLNVSTQPCHHRWYTLVRSCSEDTNLSNCPEKLKLEGWESRCSSCPWCDPSESSILDDSTYRLFGGRRDSSNSAVDGRFRRASSATNSTTSLSRSSSRNLDVEDEDSGRGEKARLMNWRLDVYLMGNPDRKYRDVEDVAEIDPDVSSLRRSSSIRRSGSFLGRKVKRSMRLGKTIFKG